MNLAKKYNRPAEVSKNTVTGIRAHGKIGNHHLTPAGKNKRVIAFIIDLTLGAAITEVTSKAYTSFLIEDEAFFLAQLTIVWFYWVLPTYATGKTLGKKFLGLQVIRYKDSKDLTILQVIYRETFARIISWLSLGLGFLWISFNAERRAWHDLLSNTRVIER